MNLEALGMTAALGSAASWAIGAILFKRLGEQLSPLAMTLVKGIVSLFLLAIVLAWVGYERIDHNTSILLTISGLLGIALGDSFFFEALQDLGPHALVLLLMLGQVLTVILAVVWLGETPTLMVWVGIALVVGGIGVVISGKLTGEKGLSTKRGIVFGLLSVFCMSSSIIIAKEALESVSALQATFVRMLAGTLGMFCFGLLTRRLQGWVQPFEDYRLLVRFLVAVIVVTFGGFWLSLVAIKYVDVSIANTLNSTEPIFLLPLGAIFLREPITKTAVIGTVLTMVGIIFICTY